MIKKDYKKGDRVEVLTHGSYVGLQGTIMKRAQVQYGVYTRYNIELDDGRNIILHFMQIKPIEE